MENIYKLFGHKPKSLNMLPFFAESYYSSSHKWLFYFFDFSTSMTYVGGTPNFQQPLAHPQVRKLVLLVVQYVSLKSCL